ncbi:glycosyltransferase [Laspinema olomoucense]|uniref:glycosyltransferase n=1 Tax=Laspinema olomoucense TaxID=3231600 RepID=UPI0021BA63B6|nr:glycosyltransferase [Laspinema sp. D3a]MCT7990840.1 glycosyltransferase [Laspinema sp. D3a]
MNIAFYLKVFPSKGKPLNRGLKKAVDGLASGLVDCGANVSVLCEGEQDSSFLTEQGYEVKCFANNYHKVFKFSVSPNLEKHLVQNSYDIVVLHGIFHPSLYSLSRLIQKHGTPYIVAPHDPYHPYIFKKNYQFKWLYWHFFERKLLREASLIQLLDIRHGDLLKNLKIETPFVAIPNGFDSNDIILESSLNWTEQGPAKLLFLGRIDSYNKGLDILVDSFAELLKMTEINLNIQGPDFGDKKMLLKKAESLGVSKKFGCKEPDFHVSPTSIIAECDIFCLPSRFEGFGLSALEAMQAGRVLLVTEIAGISPYVKASGCGVVVQPNVASVTEGLLELLACRAHWKEMGLAGRRYVEENLQWKTIAADALEKYNRLLKQ